MRVKILSMSAFIVFSTRLVFSQQIALPGGVEEPLFWLRPQIKGECYYWQSMTKTIGQISRSKQNGASFNFNPGIVFDNTSDLLTLPLGVESKKQQTIFIAYEVKDSLKEQFIWTLNDMEKLRTVATNKRLVDLNQYYYKTYKNAKLHKANIHFFQQNVTDSIATSSSLVFGHTLQAKKLPPEGFKGSIAEIVVYNRVLSTRETQKVMSYFGVKYGISLSQYEMKNYVNSRNEIIWDIDKHSGFDASITGIGRDDGSGLLQLKSSNRFNNGLLTIELKSKSNHIPDNYFVFWSDNGKDLLVRKQRQGEPIGILREWQLDFFNQSDLSLDWTFNPAYVEGPFPTNSYFWLLVDHSGKGTYDEKDSECVRLASTSCKERISLSDFNWDRQKTGHAKFTLKVAPKMFSRVWFTEASCGVQDSGQLLFAIEGGEAPFNFAIKKMGSEVVLKEWSQTSRNSTAISLSSGSYQYTVRDKLGNQYSETVFVADKDGTFSNLKSDYLLTDDSSLLLDASKDLPMGNYQYSWFRYGNLISDNPDIRINQPGDYELRITNDQNCKTSKHITINSDGSEAVDSGIVFLYPNPTSDGKFTVAMQFPRLTDVSVSIISPTGTLVKEKHYSQIETYFHEDNIDEGTGMYLVKVISGFGERTFKVVLK